MWNDSHSSVCESDLAPMYSSHATSKLRIASSERNPGGCAAAGLLRTQDWPNVRRITDPYLGNISARAAHSDWEGSSQLDQVFPPALLDAKIPDSLSALFERFDDLYTEMLIVLLFDQSGHYLKEAQLSSGQFSHILGRFRPIVELALSVGARKMLLAHNHPSGDPEPSESDIRFTHNLVRICKPLEIQVVDHVVVGRRSAVSMRGSQLL